MDAQVNPGQTAHLPTGNSMQIQTACIPPNLATQRQAGPTALPSLQLKPIYMPDDDSARPAGHAVDSARSADHVVAH